MQIIMPTLFFIGTTNILGIQMLVPLEREKAVLYSEIAGAIVDMILNAILIPFYSTAGAAIGTLMAEVVVFVVQYFSIRTEANYVFKNIRFKNIIMGSMLGMISSFWVRRLGFDSFITLLISACLFFGVYGGFLFVTKESLVIEIFNQVIEKIKKVRR